MIKILSAFFLGLSFSFILLNLNSSAIYFTWKSSDVRKAVAGLIQVDWAMYYKIKELDIRLSNLENRAR